MEMGPGFLLQDTVRAQVGFHLQARVWGALGARGGGVWDAVVGRVLAMGLRAEVAEQGVVGRCRPGCGGGTEHGSAVTVGEMLEHIKR